MTYLVNDLADEVELGHQRSLENNRDVAGVEQLDRVSSTNTTLILVLHRKVDSESLSIRPSHQEQFNSSRLMRTWKKITIRKMTTVARRFVTLGKFWR